MVTSAGALVDELKRSGVHTISLITPYVRPLTDLVVAYIRHEGIAVVDSIALSIADNVAVGARNAQLLLEDVERLTRPASTRWFSQPAFRCRRSPRSKQWKTNLEFQSLQLPFARRAGC